jgi:hypothetical protein
MKKLSVACILLLLTSASLASAYVLLNIFLVGGPLCGTNLIQVNIEATYQPQNDTLLLNVKSLKNQTYNLNQVTIRDSAGQVLVNRGIEQTKLSPYGASNITVDLGGYVFASGEYYRVELGTLEGNSFESILNVYEKVKTQVSAFTGDTISVYVQSYANQTVTFNKATIYKISSQPDDGQKSQYPVEVTLSPQIELLPNHNITITIPYTNDLKPGNYTVYLHSSPTLVIGAMTSFAVTGQEEYFNQTSTR